MVVQVSCCSPGTAPLPSSRMNAPSACTTTDPDPLRVTSSTLALPLPMSAQPPLLTYALNTVYPDGGPRLTVRFGSEVRSYTPEMPPSWAGSNPRSTDPSDT